MLEIQNLSKTFPEAYAPALEMLNFSLKTGEFCILLGSNGSGKSTLLKTILGEHDDYNGEILVNNEAHKNSKNHIAYVDQNIYGGTISEMTLLENIALSLIVNKKASFRYYEKFRKEIISIIAELNIGLERYIDQKLSSLSGGQRQIIATLIAINSAPPLLLLDEHTSALDPKMQNLLMEYTNQKIRETNLTSIMITHKLEDALNYGDRLIVMHNGKIVFNIYGKEKSSLKKQDLENLFHKLHNFNNY